MLKTKNLFMRGAAAVVVSVSAFATLGLAAPAAATSCVWYSTGAGYGGPGYGYNYYWGPNMTVPYNSACHDINISNIRRTSKDPGGWGYFRVRFYPAGGGSYLNHSDFQKFSGGGVIASDVRDGTVFRVETSGGDVPISFDLYD